MQPWHCPRLEPIALRRGQGMYLDYHMMSAAKHPRRGQWFFMHSVPVASTERLTFYKVDMAWPSHSLAIEVDLVTKMRRDFLYHVRDIGIYSLVSSLCVVYKKAGRILAPNYLQSPEQLAGRFSILPIMPPYLHHRSVRSTM